LQTHLKKCIKKQSKVIRYKSANLASIILKRTGKVTAPEVKNAFQGIASVQKTLLVLFGEIMREFYSRVGINRAKASYLQYVHTQKYLQRFLKEKYIQSIVLHQYGFVNPVFLVYPLYAPFVEAEERIVNNLISH
jgi:hypothetical protein